MHSFKNFAVLAASTLLSLSQAQTIDPNSVNITDRTSWCSSQIATCPLLCLQNSPGEDATTAANDCDPTTLNYDCICGNGVTPSLANYSQTIPYFECTEFGNQCVAGCGGDSGCASACRQDHPCGAQNPTRINVTSSSTMSATALPSDATSGTAGVVYNGLGGGAAATPTATSGSGSGSGSSTTQDSSKKSGSQAALDVGRAYGLIAVLGSVFAGFAFVL